MKLSKARVSSDPKHNLKVTVYWGDILYETIYVQPKNAVTVGRGAGNTIVVPLEGNDHRESLELIKVGEDNSVDLAFDESIQGHVRIGGEFLRLQSMIDEGRVSRGESGLYSVRMAEKDEADLVIGHVSFYLNWTDDKVFIPKTAAQDKKRSLIVTGICTLALFMIMGLVNLFELPEEEPPPERLVKLKPRPKKKAKAALGKKIKKDGGAQKGDPGKKKLSTKPKLTEAQKLEQELSGDLFKDLSDVGTQAPRRAKTQDSAVAAAIDQEGSGGFTTQGFKTGAGGKSKGLGRTVGQGEGGFAGTGRLGLSGNSAVEGSEGYGAVETVTEGGLDRDVIDAIVRKRKARIRLCYERQLNFQPKLAGKVTVAFVIGKTGSVVRASISEDTMKSSAVNACIVSEVKTWKFPPPKGGTLVNVDYPFVFESSQK